MLGCYTAELRDETAVTSLVEENAGHLRDRTRLILIGYDSFRKHHQAFHAKLEELDVPHVYRDGPYQKHHWHSGWVEPALKLLLDPGKG